MILIGAVWLASIVAAIAYPPLTLAAAGVCIICLFASVALRR